MSANLKSAAILILSIICFGSFFTIPALAATSIDYDVVVFGDSNSEGFAGIQTWVSKLQASVNPNTSDINFIVTNYSVGGTTMTQQSGLNSFRDTTGFQNFINDPNSSADLAIVMLGSNDAFMQVSSGTYTANTQSFLTELFNSNKIGNVMILGVPPMMSPWNCIGSSCPVYDGSNNPNNNWIAPYNSYLSSSISSYCTTLSNSNPNRFPMNCNYLNTVSTIAANSTYLYWDGIHLLDNSQQIIKGIVQTNLHTYSRYYITNAPAYLNIENISTGNSLLSTGVGANSRFITAQLRKTYPVAQVNLDLRTNRDWSAVSADIDLENAKSVVSDLTNINGNFSTYDLLIPQPSSNTNTLKICPGATSLSEISITCTNGYILNSTDSNVSTIVVDSENYWKVTGLSGANGGLGGDYLEPLALTQPSPVSPVDNAEYMGVKTKFTWDAATTDPLYDPVTYDIYLGNATDNLSLVATNITATEYSPELIQGSTYFWQIVAKDTNGRNSSSEIRSFTTVKGNIELNTPSKSSPTNTNIDFISYPSILNSLKGSILNYINQTSSAKQSYKPTIKAVSKTCGTQFIKFSRTLI